MYTAYNSAGHDDYSYAQPPLASSQGYNDYDAAQMSGHGTGVHAVDLNRYQFCRGSPQKFGA